MPLPPAIDDEEPVGGVFLEANDGPSSKGDYRRIGIEATWPPVRRPMASSNGSLLEDSSTPLATESTFGYGPCPHLYEALHTMDMIYMYAFDIRGVCT